MHITSFLSQPTPYKYEFLKIISYVLGIPIEKLYSSDIEISDSELIKIQQLFKKYTDEQIPLEYLIGEVEFLWNNFFVNENVLIPRPETEYLVQYVIDYIKNLHIITDNKHKITDNDSHTNFNKYKLSAINKKISCDNVYSKNIKIYDIWTGSWIIWISICKSLNLPVICSDISEKALEVAKINAKKLWCDKVKFVKSNLAGHIRNNEFKIICANLPYIPEDFKLDEYAKKEPALALFASNNGVALYEKLLTQVSNAILFLELTKKQAWSLVEKFKFDNYKILDTCHENIKILKIVLT